MMVGSSRERSRRRSSGRWLGLVLGLLLVLWEAAEVAGVGGGGNSAANKPDEWNGGPMPNTIGETLPIFQPKVTAGPMPNTPGSMGAVIDLKTPPLTGGPGNYSYVSPIGQRAKIMTYTAPSNTQGLGYFQTGMPTLLPVYDDPWYGVVELALSQEDDTYQVGVKYNDVIKILKFDADDNLVYEFEVNTLGMVDSGSCGFLRYCNATCTVGAGCYNDPILTRVSGPCTDLWGLVAHWNATALGLKVADRVWFQYYDTSGTLLQNVQLNVWDYPPSEVLSEPGQLNYGYAYFANAFSGGGFPNYRVYYAYFHNSEGSCQHEGEALIIVDPTNWKACEANYGNYHGTVYGNVAVALTWLGSHSFARRLGKVKTGDPVLTEDLIALAVLDVPYGNNPNDPQQKQPYPGKGGLMMVLQLPAYFASPLYSNSFLFLSILFSCFLFLFSFFFFFFFPFL